MTVRENVEMGAFTIDDRALVAQRLKTVEELYPIVRDRAGEKAGSLSGGQQRLVEFARCMMLDPTLIVLDEPSMGLDPQTRQIVFEMVELMNSRGKTILLVEQNARAGLKLSSTGWCSRTASCVWRALAATSSSIPRSELCTSAGRWRRTRHDNSTMRAPVTIRDVARVAGVHPGTVSRALNGETRGLVNEETARRVLEVAAELGYRPNPIARGLKTNRSYTVGVLIPDLTNPLFPPVVRGSRTGSPRPATRR